MIKNFRKILWGLGFDCKDGHLRVTKGENFRLYGGSEETHEAMQETVVKFNEQLTKRHKTLDNLSEQDFCDIAHELGLKIPEKKNKRKEID